jgi:hypothetical protein
MDSVYADDFGKTPKKANGDYRGAVWTGGVSTSGGRGFGLATGPGAGRTSIGGGNGATC